VLSEKWIRFITVSSEDFNTMVCIIGIDTEKHCGPFSNIDYVHFVRENFLRFSYKKFAMALSPNGSIKLPKPVCLKYYRVESEGWEDHANCNDCVARHMDDLNPSHTCSGVPDECSCKLCRHQSPSLADSARHVIFNYSLHLDRFELTDEKTYSQYVYAVRSNRVPLDNLLPPETLLSVYGTYTIFPLQISTRLSGCWVVGFKYCKNIYI